MGSITAIPPLDEAHMRKSPIEGYWFYTFNMGENGKRETIRFQGMIVADMPVHDSILVDLFSWISGDYTNSQLITYDEIADEAILFRNADEALDWYENNKHHYQDVK